MWKRINISEKAIFLQCKISLFTVNCVLYDLNESWVESLSLSTVLDRAKELNKRIQFDEDTICLVLEKSTPMWAAWQLPQMDNDEVMSLPILKNDKCDMRQLQLKYNVESHPFNFVWNFRKQTVQEVFKLLIIPSHKTVDGLVQQLEEMRETIRKKDLEIRQYKIEGAVLKRVTVKTQPFNFDEFDEKYASIISMQKELTPLIDHWKTLDSGSAETEVAAKIKSSPTNTNKLSPRNRKRKALEMQQQRLERKLNACKQKLQYESSQSQSQSQNDSKSSSDDDDITKDTENLTSPTSSKVKKGEDTGSPTSSKVKKEEDTASSTSTNIKGEDLAELKRAESLTSRRLREEDSKELKNISSTVQNSTKEDQGKQEVKREYNDSEVANDITSEFEMALKKLEYHCN